MISKKFNEILNFNLLYVMFFVPFLFNILNYSQNGFFLHDTLGYYERFKYLAEYLREFKDFPLWVDHFFYGTNSLFLFIKIGFIGTTFALITSLFKINTYFSFIL